MFAGSPGNRWSVGGGRRPAARPCIFWKASRLAQHKGLKARGGNCNAYGQLFPDLEDVILQRALRYVQKGCYVDVGASLPDTDSLSYAFYRRGWRGICVEPQAYSDGWNRLRPEDTFINAAVGEEQGSAILHVYDRVREVSTASPEIDRTLETIWVPSGPLSICSDLNFKPDSERSSAWTNVAFCLDQRGGNGM